MNVANDPHSYRRAHYRAYANYKINSRRNDPARTGSEAH